jgi:hypothetical protein
MKRYILTIAALAFLLGASAPLATAQTPGAQPAAAAQDPAAEEAAAYKAWYDANQAKDYPKAMELAKAYLDKFPSGKYAKYLKDTWIPPIRAKLLQDAVQAKNIPEIIRLGKEAVAANPDSLDFPLFLATQMRTLDTNFQNTAETTEFTQNAIRLIEAGKTPTKADGYDKNKTLAYLHDSLAAIDENKKSPEKALEQYHTAAMLDPSTARYFFNCGRLHQDRYVAAAQKYQGFPQEARTAAEPSAEVKAALDEVNKEADGVINCWARFLALKSDYSEDTKKKVMTALTDLYKYRHNDSTDGLQKLIDDNKTSPTPVSMTPPPVQPAASAEQKAVDQSSMTARPGAPAAKPAPAQAKPNGKKPR